jgi:hypothetical protein
MGSNYAGAATYPATILVPDDGDPIDASVFDTPIEQLADRTAYFKDRSSHYLVGTQIATQEPASDVAPALLKSWTATTYSDANLYNIISLSVPLVPVTDDDVEIVLTCNLSATKAAASVATFGTVRPFVQQDGATWAQVPGSVWCSACEVLSGERMGTRATFHFRVTLTGIVNNFAVALNGRVSAVTDTPATEIDDGWTCIANVWRPS